jgi:hypothetical protein
VIGPRLLALAAAAIGCSGSSAAPPDAAAGDDAAPGSLDLSRAEWEVSPTAAVSPGYAGGATQAFTSAGLTVAWHELTAGDRQVFAASEDADFTAELVAPEPDIGYFGTRLAAGGDVLHLVYNAIGASGESEIFYSRNDGGGWSEPVDLTGPLEPVPRRDVLPQILIIEGEIVVLYLSAPNDDRFSPGIHLIRFADGATPGGVEVVIDNAEVDCGILDAVAGPGGSIHLVAECAFGEGEEEIVYLTNRSGSFVRQSAAIGGVPRRPAIALGPESSVHLVWSAEGDCDGITCRDVFYSRQLGPAISVTGGSQDGGDTAKLVVFDSGHVIVAFQRTGGDSDLYWTYANPGAGFVRVQSATPGTRDTIEYFIGQLTLDPGGFPHMVFIRDFRSADPIEADVFRAVLR